MCRLNRYKFKWSQSQRAVPPSLSCIGEEQLRQLVLGQRDGLPVSRLAEVDGGRGLLRPLLHHLDLALLLLGQNLQQRRQVQNLNVGWCVAQCE